MSSYYYSMSLFFLFYVSSFIVVLFNSYYYQVSECWLNKTGLSYSILNVLVVVYNNISVTDVNVWILLNIINNHHEINFHV